MKLICDDMLRVLIRSLRVTLPASFTGKVTLTLNFHGGTAASVAVGFEEGAKLNHNQ